MMKRIAKGFTESSSEEEEELVEEESEEDDDEIEVSEVEEDDEAGVPEEADNGAAESTGGRVSSVERDAPKEVEKKEVTAKGATFAYALLNVCLPLWKTCWASI